MLCSIAELFEELVSKPLKPFTIIYELGVTSSVADVFLNMLLNFSFYFSSFLFLFVFFVSLLSRLFSFYCLSFSSFKVFDFILKSIYTSLGNDSKNSGDMVKSIFVC